MLIYSRIQSKLNRRRGSLPCYSNYSNMMNFDFHDRYYDSPYDDCYTMSPEYLYDANSQADHFCNYKQPNSCCSALCSHQSCQHLPNENAFYSNKKQICHNCHSISKPTCFQSFHGNQCFANSTLNQGWQPFLNNGRTHQSYHAMNPNLIPDPSPFRNPNIYKYTDNSNINQAKTGRRIFGFQRNRNSKNLSKLSRYSFWLHLFYFILMHILYLKYLITKSCFILVMLWNHSKPTTLLTFFYLMKWKR